MCFEWEEEGGFDNLVQKIYIISSVHIRVCERENLQNRITRSPESRVHFEEDKFYWLKKRLEERCFGYGGKILNVSFFHTVNFFALKKICLRCVVQKLTFFLTQSPRKSREKIHTHNNKRRFVFSNDISTWRKYLVASFPLPSSLPATLSSSFLQRGDIYSVYIFFRISKIQFSSTDSQLRYKFTSVK